jgi:hypothetical protein
MRHQFYIFVLSTVINIAIAHAFAPPETCEFNTKLQAEKSAELRRLETEDQADRSGSFDQIDWSKVTPRDLQRRIAVAGIFAEGCFKTAGDYASAALIFQHGTTADHFYQTFIWANQAVKLGDESQRWLTAAGLDRYLVKTGQKQLFGTQFSKAASGNFCIQPVEPSFPEAIRLKYIGKSLSENTAMVLKALGASQSPQAIRDCEPYLKATPRRTVPGFW